MRPFAVLILVLGAIASLLFAVYALLGSDRGGTVLTNGPVVRPAEAAETRPRGELVAPLESAAELVTRERTEAPVEQPDRAAQTGLIRGEVVDLLGAPIEGATVRLSRGEGAPSELNEAISLINDEPPALPVAEKVTGVDGRFTFSGLQPDDRWRIHVSHARYTSRAVGPIDVPATGGVDERVVLSQGLAIYGRVIEADSGVSIPGARLSIENPLASFLPNRRRAAATLEVEANERGEYEIQNIPGGNHTIKVSAPGYATLYVTNFTQELRVKSMKSKEPEVWATNRGAQLRELAAKPNEPVEWDFELQEGQVIAGRVLGPDRAGIPGVALAAINQSGNVGSRGQAVTTEGGEFLIEDLGDGVYTLQAEAAGYQATPLQRVEVGRTDVEIVLARQGGISGTVVDAATGRPVRGFTVRVRTLHPRNITWGGVAAKKVQRDRSDGSYSVDGISEGDYVVEAFARGYASSFSEPVRVEQGLQTRDVVVRLTKGGTLTGRVVDSYTGDPIAGATVKTNDNNYVDSEVMALLNSMSQSATSKASTTTDASGTFRLELLTPDTYQLAIERAGYTAVIENDVRVEDGGTTEVGPYELSKGAMISGVVYDNLKEPVPGAQVNMRPSSDDYFGSYSARSDAHGRFVIRNAKSGEYKLSASRPTSGDSNPFAPVIDIQHSETEISVLDGGQYEHDLFLPAQTYN